MIVATNQHIGLLVLAAMIQRRETSNPFSAISNAASIPTSSGRKATSEFSICTHRQHASDVANHRPQQCPLGDPIKKFIGPSGILKITECDRNQKYRVNFYPNVSKEHIKALYATYQSVITSLEHWLRHRRKFRICLLSITYFEDEIIDKIAFMRVPLERLKHYEREAA